MESIEKIQNNLVTEHLANGIVEHIDYLKENSYYGLENTKCLEKMKKISIELTDKINALIKWKNMKKN